MHTDQHTQSIPALEKMLEEYGDLFLEMEGALESFETLYTDIGYAMDDICDEMERLQEYLDKCAIALRACRRQCNRNTARKLPGC